LFFGKIRTNATIAQETLFNDEGEKTEINQGQK
jgi:hypothetical protein